VIFRPTGALVDASAADFNRAVDSVDSVESNRLGD
jgi:hypothetical protein